MKLKRSESESYFAEPVENADLQDKVRKMISLINPVRISDAMPNFSMAQNRLGERWAVNLAVDLNIIAKMERCIFEDSSIEDEGLSNLLSLLEDGKIALLPGFAFFEVSAEFAPRARGGYEAFTLKYLPNYSDTPETTYLTCRDVTQTRRYDDASHDKRVTFSRTYIAMLLLFIISKQVSVNPEHKFLLFLTRMAALTGIVGVLEARTAQFVFFDRSGVPSGPWFSFCRSIKSNFLKSGGTSEKIRLNSFNQAHDLNLIKAATSIHGLTENGLQTDYWVATDDEGLMNLCSTFRYNIANSGHYSGEFILVNDLFSELCAPGFWKNTENIWKEYQHKRSKDLKLELIQDLTFDQLERNVMALHLEVDALPCS